MAIDRYFQIITMARSFPPLKIGITKILLLNLLEKVKTVDFSNTKNTHGNVRFEKKISMDQAWN